MTSPGLSRHCSAAGSSIARTVAIPAPTAIPRGAGSRRPWHERCFSVGARGGPARSRRATTRSLARRSSCSSGTPARGRQAVAAHDGRRAPVLRWPGWQHLRGADVARAGRFQPSASQTVGSHAQSGCRSGVVRYRRSFPVSTNETHSPWFLKPNFSQPLSLHSSFVVGSPRRMNFMIKP